MHIERKNKTNSGPLPIYISPLKANQNSSYLGEHDTLPRKYLLVMYIVDPQNSLIAPNPLCKDVSLVCLSPPSTTKPVPSLGLSLVCLKGH